MLKCCENQSCGFLQDSLTFSWDSSQRKLHRATIGPCASIRYERRRDRAVPRSPSSLLGDINQKSYHRKFAYRSGQEEKDSSVTMFLQLTQAPVFLFPLFFLSQRTLGVIIWKKHIMWDSEVILPLFELLNPSERLISVLNGLQFATWVQAPRSYHTKSSKKLKHQTFSIEDAWNTWW